MTTEVIKIDKAFLEEQVLVSTIMMDLFIDRSQSFYKHLKFEMSQLAYEYLNAEVVLAIQSRLREKRDAELKAGMVAIGAKLGINFDPMQAIEFMETFLVSNNIIEVVNFDNEVKLAIIETSTQGFVDNEFGKDKLDEVLKGTKTFAQSLHDVFMLQEMVHLNRITDKREGFPIQDVISSNKPTLSEPRGKLKAVK